MPTDKLRSTTFAAGPNAVLPAFEDFQRARVEFAQEVAKLALPEDPLADKTATAPGGTYEVDGREKVVATLEASYNLLADTASGQRPVPCGARECAAGHGPAIQPVVEAAAAGRGGGYARRDHLRDLDGRHARAHQGRALHLHAAVQPSVDVANFAVERNVLPALCERLEDRDSSIKAAAVWCFGAIANRSADLASVADSEALQLLLQCLKEPSLPLRRVALACLGCIAKRPPNDLVNKDGALAAAVGFLTHKDMLLRRPPAACSRAPCGTTRIVGGFPQGAAECRGDAACRRCGRRRD